MKISIIIPVYNEASTIKEIVSRVQKTDLDKEIIIVDDYSTDATSLHLKEISAGTKMFKYCPTNAIGGKALP